MIKIFISHKHIHLHNFQIVAKYTLTREVRATVKYLYSCDGDYKQLQPHYKHPVV